MMPEQLVIDIQPNTAMRTDDEIHLLDLLVALAKHKRLVIGAPIVCGALALAASLLITPIFSSTAKIMPPRQQQSSGISAAMLGSLGGLAGAAGGIAGIKNPNDLYVGLLESRTVADNLIARFNLKSRYRLKTLDETRSALRDVSEFVNGKTDGLISVSVNDPEPQFAADLANAYVDELEKLTRNLAISEASQRRMFFEKQLKDVREQLASAEVALRSTQEKTGMIQPAAQVEAIIATAAQIKGLIAAKEVQLNGMSTFSASQNPELLRAREELRGLQVQLVKLERNHPSSDGDFMVPTSKIPEVGVEYVRSVRNVKYYESIFELLSKQFEIAKIDEAKDSSLIQVLDKAMPAERKSKPKRTLIALLGAVGGLIGGIAFAFMRVTYTASLNNPESTKRWQQLSMAWKRTKRENI